MLNFTNNKRIIVEATAFLNNLLLNNLSEKKLMIRLYEDQNVLDILLKIIIENDSKIKDNQVEYDCLSIFNFY